MKYVFFGTAHHGPIVLERLIDAGLPPLALVTNPDKPAGRKKILTPPLTKRLVLGRGLPIQVLQPEKLSSIVDELRAFEADFFLVAAYGKIIPKAVLDIPRLGTVGIHTSFLPAYRGPSPVQTAILNGEEAAGVTVYMLAAGIDDGPVLAAQAIKIGDKDHEELRAALAELGADMFIKILPEFLAGKIAPVPQDHGRATLTRKFETKDGFVAPEDLAEALAGDPRKSNAVLRKIRALNPEPGVWTLVNGKRLKLLKAELDGGKLRLKLVQREGKTPQEFQPEFLAGSL